MPEIKPTMFKKLFLQSGLPPIHNLLNLWAICDDAVIGLDLQMSFVYEIIPPDLIHKDEGEIFSFFQSIKNCVTAIPEDVDIQFLLQIRNADEDKIRRYKETVQSEDEIAKLVVDWKVKQFRESFIQRKRYFMFITTHPVESQLSAFKPPVVSIINKNYKPITEEMHKMRINKLWEISQMLTSNLKSVGIKITQLGSGEITNFLYGYLNPGRVDFMPAPKVSPDKTLRSQICYNACENNFDHLYLDGYYYRAVNLLTRPESVHYLMLHRMISRLTPDCDVVVTIKSENQEKLIKQVHHIETMAKNVSGLSMFRKNYEAALKAKESEQLISDIKATSQKLYNFSLSVIMHARTLVDLTTRTNMAVQSFLELGESEGIIDDMNHLPLFLSVIPGHSHLNFRKHIFHTEAIAQLLPVSAPWIGCAVPKMIFKTDDDQILPIDLFDDKITSSAKCGLIIGTQGSGKSFTVNYFLSNFNIESKKNHIIIIDVGGSYRKLCSDFSGQYLEVELSEKYAFNPFPSPSLAVINTDKNNFEVDPDTIEFLTLLTQKMLKLKELSGREQKILENVIVNTYRICGAETPLLGMMQSQLLNYEGDDEDRATAKSYAKNLEIWTTGRYGKLVNRPSTISPDARLVAFDLQKLQEQPELQTIIFFLIQTVIESKLKDRTLQKMVVIDEGWSFFSDPIGSKLIINLYKTIRKFNGVVWSISQSPKDFLQTPAADAIITNSIIKIILRLESGYELLEKFKLTPPQVETTKHLLATSTFREVFIKYAEFCRVIKIEPSKLDYWICTTNAKDFTKEQQYREEHPGLTEIQILEGLAKGG